MNTCDNDHTEIVDEANTKYHSCPLCESQEELTKVTKEVEELRKEMEEHVCKE